MTGSASVIGGGIAGLATAALLARDGWQVTLFEARDELGGRAGSWERDGFRFDTGPSWYLMPDVFEHFFRLMGTTAADELDLVPLTPAYRVYPEPEGTGPSTPLDIVSGRREAHDLFEAREPGAGARLDAYLDSAADAYDLAVSKFLYDTYASTEGLRDPAVVRRVPELVPLLTRSLERHVARSFDDPLLRQVLGYPAVFLGASPSTAPALYHLMSRLDLDDGVLYPQGGFTELIAAAARVAAGAGATLRTSSPVERILVEGGRARGVRLTDGSEHRSDIVVSTADLHHTETRLLEKPHRSYSPRWWDKRNPGPGALLLLLGVEGELPQLAHHTLLFAQDWISNFDDIFGETPRIPDPASIYICRPSATDPTVAPAGDENLFVLVPMPADPSLGHGGVDGAGDETIERAADRVIAQISAWTGIPDLGDRIRVRRTISPADFASDLGAFRGGALGMAHTLRQSAMFRPKNVSRRVDGLLYAGTSVLPGIGLPMCLISAELVVKRLRGDRTAARLPEPSPTAT
ncbi:phytoene desaturase family protein [Microbacterium dextranolyticum]|uniref:Phytoene desaturase n=1 Tax=Microbacterium dextranolyticum TaxID=36806 RepID=A0A9W6HN47_9MICO|nr:phytoene desaturase family protein [Microbacterium dextranolyticum]MBM7463259.1 phytoene desaturase [Microbacterium dextranolyticum]GLJ95635.1 phytoene desaturase [Microbacterium dextranolyticum]